MGAYIAVVGTLLGTGISLGVYWFLDEQKRKRRAEFAAIAIVYVLKGYIYKCEDVCRDDGYEEETAGWPDGGSFCPRIRSPEPPEYPKDIDWQSLQNNNMVSQAFSFLVKTREAEKTLDQVYEDGSCPPELYTERQYQYALIGDFACQLVDKLCEYYKIPKSKLVDEKSKKFFLEIINRKKRS